MLCYIYLSQCVISLPITVHQWTLQSIDCFLGALSSVGFAWAKTLCLRKLCPGSLTTLLSNMLFTPIYIAMTFIKTWRIRSFRARLLEFLSGNTSVAFCKVPENAAGKLFSVFHSLLHIGKPMSTYPVGMQVLIALTSSFGRKIIPFPIPFRTWWVVLETVPCLVRNIMLQLLHNKTYCMKYVSKYVMYPWGVDLKLSDNCVIMCGFSPLLLLLLPQFLSLNLVWHSFLIL